MNEMKRFESGEINKPLSGEVEEAVRTLKGDGSKHYLEIVRRLQMVDVSADEKDAVRTALFDDLQGQIERGQFQEIDRARELMNFLGVTEFSLSRESIDKIVELYERYPYGFLIGMSPSLYDGKLGDGKPYDEIEYVRNMMKKTGKSDPSDEEIKELWKYREILVKLHARNWDPQKQLAAIPKLLTGK